MYYLLLNWKAINFLWKSFFFLKRLNIADILFCEDVVSLTDIHVVNTRKKNLFVNFTDMNVLFENKAVPWNLGGGRHSELKIAGLADVLTLSNGWKMSEHTPLQHFKCFLNWYIHDVSKQIRSFQKDLNNQINCFKLNSYIFNY